MCIDQFALPRQSEQDVYLEVWVEKDALSGVLSRVTNRYHIPILVCRGYSSASAMFDSYQRFKKAYNRDQVIRILYIGDFDPSGEDMVRDISDRINEFADGDESVATANFPFTIEKIALTKTQIKKYNPPPNPAKMSDPRTKDFVALHGSSSWEVDALKPEVLDKLLDDKIKKYIDLEKYEAVLANEELDKSKLLSLKEYL